MGKLYVVGFGPGGYEHMTAKCIDVIKNADVVTGYTTYVNILKEYFPDKNYIATPMMQEVKRCEMAVEEAMKDQTVAMVSSGDSGIYGMAGIIYQVAEEKGAQIEIETVPGVTAASAAASVLGDLIMKRVDCAGQGDLIVCLYNPKSKKRVDYVEKAADILMKYRKAETPVGIVRNAGRKDESHCITTLGALKDADIDMFSVVIIGNSQTYEKNGRMITPRGYRL